MPKSLYWKITIAIILVAFATAALVAVLIRITSADRLTRLVIDQQSGIMEEALVDYYEQVGSWKGINQYWVQLQQASAWISAQNASENEQDSLPINPQFERDRRNLFGLADARGTWVVPIDPDDRIGESVNRKALRNGTQILVDGEQVGTLLTASELPGYNTAETQFIRRTNQALLLAMLGALVVALLIGLFLAKTLTQPLRALTNAAQNIARGELEQQVDIQSDDEIGQLASAFNRMSQEVALSHQLRQQMTADIAHDLRTPLTVIGGYIESMRDGVLQPTPERMALIYAEIERLQNLVGDLRMLSQADAGELPLNPQPIRPEVLLERTAQIFQHRANQQNVRLNVKTANNLPEIEVDEARMMQVMENLLSNSLRYTSAGGEIILTAVAGNGYVNVTVQDSGTGIPADELLHIFERFHRADPSRHTETGESGLGLSIVKALVEAHQGRVWAESEVNRGTSVHISIPVAKSGSGTKK